MSNRHQIQLLINSIVPAVIDYEAGGRERVLGILAELSPFSPYEKEIVSRLRGISWGAGKKGSITHPAELLGSIDDHLDAFDKFVTQTATKILRSRHSSRESDLYQRPRSASHHERLIDSLSVNDMLADLVEEFKALGVSVIERKISIQSGSAQLLNQLAEAIADNTALEAVVDTRQDTDTSRPDAHLLQIYFPASQEILDEIKEILRHADSNVLYHERTRIGAVETVAPAIPGYKDYRDVVERERRKESLLRDFSKDERADNAPGLH